MTDYTPKVGDRVRATLGENVLVGEVEYAQEGVIELRCNGSLFPLLYRDSWQPLYRDSWQFEQVVEVPTKFGAVIRRADGVKFTLVHPDPADRVWMRANDEDSWSDGGALYGGFTVLFEGVDE